MAATLDKSKKQQIPSKYTELNNTLLRSVKNNIEDDIKVELGDSKQPDFKPQAKIMRWDNEVNFSLRAEEHAESRVEIDGEVIKYITPDYEVHQYDKPEVGEDGGLEFEWVLPSKPESNVLTATIQTKELDFFYQPALTQEEIDRGASRAENVVGSYAVYHKTKRDFKIGDKNYKTGKAFHIYRPEAVDNDGNKTWCDLNIDENKGLLTVTIPEKFLDNASYPVKVDPTFGYTTVGGSSWGAIAYTTNDESVMQGEAFALSENANVTSLTAGLVSVNASSESIDLYGCIWDQNSGGTGTHAYVASGERANVAITNTAAAYTIDFTSESISADTYILSILGNGADMAGASNNVSVRYDAKSPSRSFYEEGTTGATSFATRKAEKPWTASASTGSYQISIYVTYTTGGGSSASASPSATPSSSPSLSPSSSQSPSSSPSSSPSLSPSSSASSSYSSSPSLSQSSSQSLSPSLSTSLSPSSSPSASAAPIQYVEDVELRLSSSPSSSISLSPSSSISSSLSPSPSSSISASPSPSSSISPSPSSSISASLSPSSSVSPSPSLSESPSPSSSVSASPSPSSSVSLSPSASPSSSVSLSSSASASPSPSSSISSSISPSSSVSLSPSSSVSSSPSSSISASPSPSPSESRSQSSSISSSPSPSSSVSLSPSLSPSSSPSISLSASPSPSSSVSPSPSLSTSLSPSLSISASPSRSESRSPSVSASSSPSPSSSVSSSESRSSSSSVSLSPSLSPSSSPSSSISSSPSPSLSSSISSSPSPSLVEYTLSADYWHVTYDISSPSSSQSPSSSPSASVSLSPSPSSSASLSFSSSASPSPSPAVYVDTYADVTTTYVDKYNPVSNDYIDKYIKFDN